MIASQEFDNALRAEVVREHPGRIVVGSYTIVCLQDPEHDDGHWYEHVTPAGQPRHSSIGLASMGMDFAVDDEDED